MYALGAVEFSAEAEAAAFRKLHNLNVAINQLRAQGLDYGSLLPYYRAALDEYRAMGRADPANLTAAEAFYLDAVDGLAQVGKFAGKVTNTALLAGALVVVGLFLWKR